MFPTRKITSCPYLEASVPTNYKKNATVGDHYCANKIGSDLEREIFTIKAKYIKAGYPNGFIDSIINYFHQTKRYSLTQSSLFEEQKEISLQLSFVKEMRRKLNELFAN